MPFTLTCPSCGSRRRVADDVAGKKVRCHDCRTVFWAAGPDVDIIEAPAEPRSRRRDRDDDRPRGKRPAGKATGKRARHGPAYFVGLAGALLLVAGAVTFVVWKAGAFGPKSDGRVKLDANGEPEYVAPDERIKAAEGGDFSQHVRLTDLRRVWTIEGAAANPPRSRSSS